MANRTDNSNNNNNEWYGNKELYEFFDGLKDEVRDMRSEMKETRALMKQYNGLRQEVNDTRSEINGTRKKIDSVQRDVDDIQAKQQGKKSVGQGIREWSGLIFSLITLCVLIASFIIGL